MTAIGSNVAATQAVISLRSYLNPIGPSNQSILNWSTADNFTADAAFVLPLTVATSTTSTFNLATLLAACTAPVFVSVTDVSNPGLAFTMTIGASGATIGVAKNSWIAWTADGTTALPTITVTNPSSTQELVISVGCLSK